MKNYQEVTKGVSPVSSGGKIYPIYQFNLNYHCISFESGIIKVSFSVIQWYMSGGTAFISKLHVRPTKTQMSLRILAVLPESLQSTQWVAKDKESSGEQWRLWSDCADAQSDLSLRWAHM